MVEYLLDTCHVIDIINNEHHLQEIIERTGPEKFSISEITLAELCVRLSKTGIKKYDDQIAFFESHFKVIPFAAHREYGELRAVLEKRGERLADMDLLIAATAIHENLILASSDNHFSRIKKLKRINLRTGSSHCK